jgi:hypothetical protein
MKNLTLWLQRALHRTDLEAQLRIAIARQERKARSLIQGEFATLFNLSADLWRIAKQLPPSDLFPPCDLVLDRIISFHWVSSDYTIEKAFDDNNDECVTLCRNGTAVLSTDCRHRRKVLVFRDGPWVGEIQVLVPHLRKFLADVAAWKQSDQRQKRLNEIEQRYGIHLLPQDGAERPTPPTALAITPVQVSSTNVNAVKRSSAPTRSFTR